MRRTKADVWTMAKRLMELVDTDAKWAIRYGNGNYSVYYSLELGSGQVFPLGFTTGEAVRALSHMREGALIQQDHGRL